MEKFEKGDVNLSGLGDATLLDIATDPEMNDQLSNQAGEEIKRRQAEGTFDDTLPEAEDDGETAEEDYYEYEQRMGKIGEKAFRRHEDLNSKAYQRKQVELDKQGRGHSLERRDCRKKSQSHAKMLKYSKRPNAKFAITPNASPQRVLRRHSMTA